MRSRVTISVVIFFSFKFTLSVSSLILFKLFAIGVVDTHGKFTAGVIDTCGNLPPVSLPPVSLPPVSLPPVSTTPAVPVVHLD